jgi:WD40 repeat protein/uncharacterized caspase-like protein
MPRTVRSNRITTALEAGDAKLWVLLVGVNHYRDPQLPSLQYPALDCRGLQEALEEATQAFPQREMQVHHDFAALPLYEAVLQSLRQIVTRAAAVDTVLVYFSGHGVLAGRSPQAFLCLADTQQDQLPETGLAVTEVLRLLGNCAAKQQVVWLDACHSGGMTLRGARGPTEAKPLADPTAQLLDVLRQRAAQSQGFYALLSCDQAQQSWEFPELGHGVFTYFLMRGLRGEAADGEGVIEADRLYKYVYHQTLQYIDKTNQQLRLINQQKRSRGETQIQPEYPLQTPKRIVEGIGELILGIAQTNQIDQYPRQALIIDGSPSNQVTIGLSKVLGHLGRFVLEYYPQPGRKWESLRSDIRSRLQIDDANDHRETTVLLYLKGRLTETPEGEANIMLGDGVQLSRSWLRQELRRSRATQQIIILDCPGATSLSDWLEDLQLGSDCGQCLLAAAPPSTDPDAFSQILLDMLQANDTPSGLPVAAWITQLQVALAGAMPLHVWLSGAPGVIELIPNRLGARGMAGNFDLGLCPYMGLRAFAETDAQYFYGRAALTQRLLQTVSQQSCIAVVGASGSGKSSLVQAGLIAQLRQGKQLPGSAAWWMGRMRPGDRPLTALAQCLVDPGTAKEQAYQQLQIEGMLHQGTEGFVHWLRTRSEPMIVLVIDQFEELFTLTAAAERQQFLDLILGGVEYAGDRYKLIFTLRADFMADGLAIPTLAPILQQSLLVPSTLSPADYRQVITQPAEQVGLTVEPGLVEVLLQDLNQAAGDLPLLEFVLEQLWEQRQSGQLTLAAYQQAIGGLRGALERKAQAVYDSLNAEGQACAQWIFLALTQLGDGTADTRRRIPKSDLLVAKYPAPLVEQTLQTLIAAKLIVIDAEINSPASRKGDQPQDEIPPASAPTNPRIPPALPRVNAVKPAATDPAKPIDPSTPPPLYPSTPSSDRPGEDSRNPLEPYRADQNHLSSFPAPVTIEIAHEILIRHWSTLRWWLDENRSRLQQQRQIEQAALAWHQSGQQPDFLLRGIRLTAAIDLYVAATDELLLKSQQFIEAGIAERQREQQLATRRLHQAQRIAVIVGMLGLTAVGMAGLAYWQQRQAKFQAIAALAASSEALLESHQSLAALLASVKAGQQLQQFDRPWDHWLGHPIATQIQTVGALQQAIARGYEVNRLVGHRQKVNDVAVSPDGQLFATASDDGIVKLWQANGHWVRDLVGQERITAVAFSPDSQTIATASADRTLKLWHRDGRLMTTLTGHQDWVTAVQFSPKGEWLASASRDGTVKLWQVKAAKLVKTLRGHKGWVNSVSLSQNGQLATAGEDGSVKLWRIDRPAKTSLIRSFTAHSSRITGVSFSPDGQTIATASNDQTAKLWTLTGKLQQTLEGHTDQVNSISFNAKGDTISTASADGTIKVWQSQGKLLKTLSGHQGEVLQARFIDPNSTLLTASADKTARLWQISDPQPDLPNSPEVNGQIVATVNPDKTIQLWQAGATIRRLNLTLAGKTAAGMGFSVSPDRTLLASSSPDFTIQLWDLRQLKPGMKLSPLRSLKGHTNHISSLEFSPDGQRLVSASNDNTIKVWQVQNGTLMSTLTGHRDQITAVAFSPDGKTIASGSDDNTIRLWQQDGTTIELGRHALAVASLAFSPDGKTLASGSWDNTIKLWDLSQLKSAQTASPTLTGHGDGVTSLNFSPDSKLLVSSSADTTVKLWDPATRTLLKTLPGHTDLVRSVRFSDAGQRLISTSDRDGARSWNLQLKDLTQQGCDRLRNYLNTNPNGSRDFCQTPP